MGATLFKPSERIWKWLFLWLVAHKRCWTVDCLARRGLPHPERCPLCDQENENIDHLLTSCVFTREFWYLLSRQIGLHALTPQPSDLLFDDWWEKANKATLGLTQKELNSLIVFGAWTVWNHRNRCVFEGASPSMVEILVLAGEEHLDCGWGARAVLSNSPPPPKGIRFV
jgi:hypothetical protein